MKTDDLILVLTADSGHQPMSLGRVFALAAGAGVLFAGVAFFLLIGVRPDFATASETIRFPFKFVVTVSLAAAAFGMVARLARPDARTGSWRWGLLVTPLLLAVAVGVELAVVPASLWGTRLVGYNALHCLRVIPLLSFGPLAFLFLAFRHGAPTRPDLAGAAAGLLASGIGATFYAANCSDDSPLFVVIWYPLAMAIVVLAGWFAGARLLRW